MVKALCHLLVLPILSKASARELTATLGKLGELGTVCSLSLTASDGLHTVQPLYQLCLVSSLNYLFLKALTLVPMHVVEPTQPGKTMCGISV